MNLKELMNSKEYKDARARLGSWAGRLKSGDKEDALRVRDEKRAYFENLIKVQPNIYTVLKLDDKTLSEKIYKIINGKEARID
jgi:hypothetical protein